VETADMVWMLVSTALVFLMIPGVCLVYSGVADRQSSLTLFRLPFLTAATTLFQYYLWGYLLAFSSYNGSDQPTSWYGNSWDAFALHNVLKKPVGNSRGKIPELVFALFQGMFAAFTYVAPVRPTLAHVKHASLGELSRLTGTSPVHAWSLRPATTSLRPADSWSS
jgi:ammonia channel protein AmtB